MDFEKPEGRALLLRPNILKKPKEKKHAIK
uniref:Uncharacterized protein n=1 Tax=Myoviridae sp. ct5kl10 TaxID=2826615 RepID=A0A8S5N8T2_9CAUD|nr:MAG TPA: hypothetical protein [Myoviridae sp. ct5kl10]